MSGRISRKMLEALEEDDEEELPPFPLYYNQFSKPDPVQNRKNYEAFVAEKLKDEKRKAEKAKENSEKQKRKKVNKTSKTLQKKPNTGKGSSGRGKSKGKHAANAQSEDTLSSESLSDGESYSARNVDMSSPPKTTLSKEAMKRLQDIHEQFEKERKEMKKMNKALLKSIAAPDDDDIVVDAIDTYDPLVDDINVRVRIRGEILLKRIRRTEKLLEVFRYVAKENNVPAVQMVIYHRDLPISVNDTPKSLDMKLAEICEGVIFGPTSSFRDDKNCINVKLQSKNSRKEVKTVISIHLIDPFSIMMKKYAEIKGLPLEKLVFEFDGDKLSPNETPLDVEMENDHVIDVKVIS